VISELRKPNCDAQVKAWADSQLPTSMYLSRVTIAEIRYGIDVDDDVFVVWRRLVERARPCVMLSLSPTSSSRQPQPCKIYAS
jgi:predicted nucleic acid-binding protein